jgi:hypothetical protein
MCQHRSCIANDCTHADGASDRTKLSFFYCATRNLEVPIAQELAQSMVSQACPAMIIPINSGRLSEVASKTRGDAEQRQ